MRRHSRPSTYEYERQGAPQSGANQGAVLLIDIGEHHQLYCSREILQGDKGHLPSVAICVGLNLSDDTSHSDLGSPHYIGFPIADIWMMNQIWFNVFLAWLFKLIILKYGGVRWYRRSMPLFLGFILGQICVAGVWMAVDSLTGTVGNFIPVGLD